MYIQEEYYATHQCFLSNRSLYLVVWAVTDGEDGIDTLGPWLHNIQVLLYLLFRQCMVVHSTIGQGTRLSCSCNWYTL